MKRDIFNNECAEFEEDHIFPLSKNGSNRKENILLMCPASNREKADKTKGTINGKRFYVKHAGRDAQNKIIGQLTYYED